VNDRSALSEREMEILRLVATGATNQEIARQLIISINTVKVHLRNIFEKLEVTSRTEATMVAVRQGWVQIPGQAGPPAQLRVEDEIGAKALPLTRPEQPPLPLQERWPRVPLGKRICLILATAAALAILVLPPMLESRANGNRQDPIQGIFPGISPGVASSRWQARAQMPTPRTHLAVASLSNRVYAIGGVGNQGVVGKVEMYDPTTDTWTSRRAKPTPAGFVSAAVLGDRIYVPGGAVAETQVIDVLEVYDPQTDSWERRTALPRALARYGLAAFDGRLYVFGGWDGQDYVATVYSYDPATDRWQELPPMEQPRGLLGAAALLDHIYVVGGYDGSTEYSSCSAYDPADGTWDECAPMAMRRSNLGLIAVVDSLYAIGGALNGYLAFNERYDPRIDIWVRFETPVVDQWLAPGLAYAFPYIYAIGGWNGTTLGVNEAYQARYRFELNP